MNFNCPVCGTPSTLIIGPTQGGIEIQHGTPVHVRTERLPDGGMSNFINLDDERKEGN